MADTTAPDKGIVPVKIEDEMRGAYLDYAMSVIIGRALPDVRDGLKPVHRRILYAMYDMGNTHDKPYKKSARVVGDVIGKYHPHGDTAVYDTIVRMAQDFSMRAPLVDGQGNFGSVDGDTAAAMRYTEIRMERITNDLLEDIEKETVDFGPNYDDSLKEPLVLPTRVPNLLVNGAGGIAVGMATNIPPHNLGEIVEATVALIHDPSLTTDDLLKYVKGPDFPTAGVVFGGSLRKAYKTGRGVITIRGKAEIEEAKGDRERIVITELPYQVNKAKLIEKIADLVKEKKIEGISDLRDESDRDGMRVVVDLKKGENSNVVLNNLFKLTQLQDSFGITLLAIHQNRPKIFELKDMIWAFVEHRKDVILRRTAFDLRKAEARAHILEGLKKAVENIDEVITLIKGSANPNAAKIALMSRFEFSELQAQAILDMRLHRLTGLEREKIIEEYNEVLKLIQRLREILASEKLVYEIIVAELEEVKKKYADKRRTEIMITDAEDFDTEDLISDDETLVTLTHKGYIKRQDVNQFRSQHRGGKGIRAMSTGEGDFVNAVFRTTNLTNLLCFTSMGRMYALKVYRIPEATRESKGKAIVNLIQLQAGELVKAVLPVREFEENKFIFFVTRAGTVKRTQLSEFRNVKQSGIIAIGLDDGDELVGAKLTDGKSEIFLSSKGGMSIRFPETDARAMGRSAYGVKGFTLESGDTVVGLEVVDPARTDAEILTVTERGYGKRTPPSAYRLIGRGGKGVINMKLSDRTGDIVGACLVTAKDDLMVISDRGQMIRINVGEISEQGRGTQGVRVMTVDEGEKVVAMEHLAGDENDSGNESAKVLSNGAGVDTTES